TGSELAVDCLLAEQWRRALASGAEHRTGAVKSECQPFVAYATKSWHCNFMQHYGQPAAGSGGASRIQMNRYGIVPYPDVPSLAENISQRPTKFLASPRSTY